MDILTSYPAVKDMFRDTTLKNEFNVLLSADSYLVTANS